MSEEIARVLPITIELITISFILAFLISVPLGMLCALKPAASRTERPSATACSLAPSPNSGGRFSSSTSSSRRWAGRAAAGSARSHDAPSPAVTGFITVDTLLAGDVKSFKDGLHHLFLPVLTKVFVLSGPIIKMVRQNMVRVAGVGLHSLCAGERPAAAPHRDRCAQERARARADPARRALRLHPGQCRADRDGILARRHRQYAVRSVLAFDYPAIQAVVLVIAAISLFVYLALDVTHALLDPRIVP